MSVFDKLKNGDPVDMMSEEYRSPIEELLWNETSVLRIIDGGSL